MLRCGSSQQFQRDVSHSDEFAACVCLQVSEALAVKGRVAAGSSGPYWSAEEGERRLSEVMGRMGGERGPLERLLRS